jgi:hypothetical protein
MLGLQRAEICLKFWRNVFWYVQERLDAHVGALLGRPQFSFLLLGCFSAVPTGFQGLTRRARHKRRESEDRYGPHEPSLSSLVSPSLKTS